MVRLLLLAFVILLPGQRASAQDRIVIADFAQGADGSGAPKGWQVKEKTGKAEYDLVRDGGLHALALRSRETSFSVQKETEVDVKQYPMLTWKWKATKLPKDGDFRRSKTDDQAAQLFLAFTRTRAIVYIWDSTAPTGLMEDAPAPPFMTIKAVVVRSGPGDLGKWITETRNVYDDYRKLFNGEPPPVSGVRLQINSQHTRSSAESFFADVAFTRE